MAESGKAGPLQLFRELANEYISVTQCQDGNTNYHIKLQRSLWENLEALSSELAHQSLGSNEELRQLVSGWAEVFLRDLKKLKKEEDEPHRFIILSAPASLFTLLHQLRPKSNIHNSLPADRNLVTLLSDELLYQSQATRSPSVYEEQPRPWALKAFLLWWISVVFLIPFPLPIETSRSISELIIQYTQGGGQVSQAALTLMSTLVARMPSDQKLERLLELSGQIPNQFEALYLQHICVESNYIVGGSSLNRLAENALNYGDHVDSLSSMDKVAIVELVALILRRRDNSLEFQTSPLRDQAAKFFTLLLADESQKVRWTAAKGLCGMLRSDPQQCLDLIKQFARYISDNSGSLFGSVLAMFATECIQRRSQSSSKSLLPIALTPEAVQLTVQQLAMVLQECGWYQNLSSTIDAIAFFLWRAARSNLLDPNDDHRPLIELILKIALFNPVRLCQRAAVAVLQEFIGRGLAGDGGLAAPLIPEIGGNSETAAVETETPWRRVMTHSPFGRQVVITSALESLLEPQQVKFSKSLTAYLTSICRESNLTEQESLSILAISLRRLQQVIGEPLAWQGEQVLQILSALFSQDSLSERVIALGVKTLAVCTEILRRHFGKPTCAKHTLVINDCGRGYQSRLVARLIVLLSHHVERCKQLSLTEDMCTVIETYIHWLLSHKCRSSRHTYYYVVQLQGLSSEEALRRLAEVVKPLMTQKRRALQIEKLKKATDSTLASQLFGLCMDGITAHRYNIIRKETDTSLKFAEVENLLSLLLCLSHSAVMVAVAVLLIDSILCLLSDSCVSSDLESSAKEQFLILAMDPSHYVAKTAHEAFIWLEAMSAPKKPLPSGSEPAFEAWWVIFKVMFRCKSFYGSGGRRGTKLWDALVGSNVTQQMGNVDLHSAHFDEDAGEVDIWLERFKLFCPLGTLLRPSSTLEELIIIGVCRVLGSSCEAEAREARSVTLRTFKKRSSKRTAFEVAVVAEKVIIESLKEGRDGQQETDWVLSGACVCLSLYLMTRNPIRAREEELNRVCVSLCNLFGSSRNEDVLKPPLATEANVGATEGEGGGREPLDRMPFATVQALWSLYLKMFPDQIGSILMKVTSPSLVNCSLGILAEITNL